LSSESIPANPGEATGPTKGLGGGEARKTAANIWTMTHDQLVQALGGGWGRSKAGAQ
jgi:hypothetical protein